MKKIEKQLKQVAKKVRQEITELAQGSHIAAGLSSEGYAGGYWDAIQDVLLALNGAEPRRRNYWK